LCFGEVSGETGLLDSKILAMKDEAKTKEQLIKELVALRDRCTEEALEHYYDIGTAVNALLRFSLEDYSLEELLQKALDIILSVSSLSIETTGSIFLVEDEPEVLIQKVQKGLAEPLLKECARVPFGKCLCGRAASIKRIEFADHIDERHEVSYKGMASHGHYCVPILLSGNTIGVINLYVKDGHSRVGRQEEFLDSVANTLAGIIKRKRAEKELRESEKKCHDLYDFLPIPVYEMDLEANIVSANRAIYETFGGTEEDLKKGFKVWQLLSPKEIEKSRNNIQRLLTGDKIEGTEYTLKRLDGSVFPAMVISSVIYSNGKPVGLRGAIIDITERKQAEEALRENQRQLADIVQFLPDPTLAINKEKRIILWNKAIEEMTGIPAAEMVGKGDYVYTIPFYGEARPQMMDLVFLDNKEVKARYPDITREGDSLTAEVFCNALYNHKGAWVFTKASPLHDQFGNIIGAIQRIRDITDRKRIEEEREKILLWQQGVNQLQQSLLATATLEEKLRAITDSIVSIFDADFCRIWLIQPGDLCEQGCVHAEVNEGPHICRYRDRCLHLLASSGRYTHTDGKIHRRVPFGCYKIGRIASDDDHKFLTNDVQNDPRVHNHEWARELGLVSFVGYQLSVTGGKTLGVLALFAKHPISFQEDTILDGLSSAVALVIQRDIAEESLHQTLESLRKAIGTTIQVMVSAVEARDPYTAGHQSRSADLARAIAKEMGLPKDRIEGIRMVGSIHDIGKLSIPAEILSKPKKLTEIEFSLIKEHSRSGYEMLKDVESPWPLAEIIYQHHERMDGSGYPRNLKGDDILMGARILAVCDVVESMASHRPYRPALGLNAALEEISRNRGVLYDPEVVDACLKLFQEKGYKLK